MGDTGMPSVEAAYRAVMLRVVEGSAFPAPGRRKLKVLLEEYDRRVREIEQLREQLAWPARCGVVVVLQGLGEWPCVVVLDEQGGHDGDCVTQPERDGLWPPRPAPDCPADDPDCEGAAQLDPATASHEACEPAPAGAGYVLTADALLDGRPTTGQIVAAMTGGDPL